MKNVRAWNRLVIACCIAAAVLFLAVNGMQTPADAASSANLPGIRTLGSLSQQYMPVKFDHPKHVTMAESCATCHHQHQESKDLDCKNCHELGAGAFKNSVKSNFMACSACHGALNPDNPTVPGLKVAYHKSCFQCHRGMGNIGASPKGCTEICHARKSATVSMRSRP